MATKFENVRVSNELVEDSNKKIPCSTIIVLIVDKNNGRVNDLRNTEHKALFQRY